MADNAVPTLAPEPRTTAPHENLLQKPQPAVLKSEKEALFNSIAQERFDQNEETQPSPLKSFFTGLLWFGYAVAIIVAVALVWSAAKGLLQELPR